MRLTALIGVRLDVPVSVHIARLVLLDAGRFDLLEAPLRQVDISGSQVAAQYGVPESESGRQGTNFGAVAGRSVVHHLNLPVVLVVSDGDVSITRDLVVRLRNGCGDGVGVQIPTSLSMDKTDSIAIADELQIPIGVKFRLLAIRVNKPVIVGILVVIAGDLLLVGSLRECLNV